MAIYTVHVPNDSSDQVTRADRTVFVREGFNLWAFLFGWVFLLWHRLWLAAAGWFVLALALGAICWVLHVPPANYAVLAALMHLFVGVEGNDLRRWTLNRRGFGIADVVFGDTTEDAELIFFQRQASTPSAPRAATPPPVARDMVPAVIGMFPDGENA